MPGRRGDYLVKEIFGPTLQGEGAHAGRPCVFLRFAVCNLACTWCDTDFSPQGARRLSPEAIAAELCATDAHDSRVVVVTGGEPALQWDDRLARELAGAGFSVHMETNGTRVLRGPVDWLTISPKPHFHEGRFSLAEPEALAPDEVKVVVDGAVTESELADYEAYYGSALRFLQPCADARYDEHLRRAIELATRRPSWRLSLQLHKVVGLP